MKILVTGSSGFIGRAICEKLLAEGHDIFGLHRQYCSGDVSSPYQIVTADIAKRDEVERISETIGACDVIIHAAASLKMELYESDVIAANCLGVQNLLWLANKWNSSQFIFLSSIPLIGVPLHHPITEEHPARPGTTYHASKYFGEHLVRIAESSKLSGIILRLPAPVGPGMPKNRLLPVLVANALKNNNIELSGRGTRQQNYIDIRDVTHAISLCLKKNISGNYNIATNACIANIDLARRCIERCNSQSRIIFNGKSDPEDEFVWDISIERAKKILGFSPRFSIDDSIDAVVADLDFNEAQ